VRRQEQRKKLEKLGFVYAVLKSHHEQFMEDEKLKQLFHTYDTNLVEGFKLLTKFLPKDRTYSQTI
jgi:hypothetical protein